MSFTIRLTVACASATRRAFCLLGLVLSCFGAASGQTQKLVVTPYSVLGSQTSLGTANTANVAVDSKDNIYYPNFYNNAIYKIDTAGNQTVVPSTGLNSPQGMRFDASDNLYLCDALNSRIVVLTPAGVQTVLPMTGLNQPQHLAFDSGYQNLYVSDRYAGILQYNLASQKTTVYATGLFRPEGIAVDAKNNVYYGDGDTLLKNGVAFTTTAGEPDALLVDPAGNLYVMSSNGNGLHRVDPSGTILALADDGSNDIAIDSHGVLVMPSHNGQHMFVYLPGPAIWGGRIDAFVGGRIDYHYANTIRTYYSTPAGVTLASLTIPTAGSPYGGDKNPTCPTTTLCGANVSLGAFLPGPQPGYALATFSDGTTTTTPLYGSGLQVEMGFTPGTTSQLTTGIHAYTGVANDRNGSVYLSDGATSKVLKVTGTTIATVPFVGLRAPDELAVDGANSVYVHDNDIGGQRIVKVDSTGKQTVPFSLSQQDGSLPAMASLSTFAVDGATNLYVSGSTAANTAVIEMYGANGVNSLYAMPPNSASAMAFDTFGTLYAAETGGTLVKYDHFANRILVTSGLASVTSLAIEPSGTIYFVDKVHPTVRQIPPGGIATNYPVAGVTVAAVVAIDNYGNLTIGDAQTYSLISVDRTTQPYGFGNVNVGASSTLHHSLVNVGSVNGLTLSSVSGDGPFTVDSGTTTCVPGTTNLAAGATCDIGFTFSPTAVQSYSNTGQVVIPLPTPSYSATVASLPFTGNGVKAAPVANPGGSYSGTAGTPVSFNGSASTDPGNEALTYAWSFGDNASGTGATPSHTYAAAGTYTVTLTVTNTDETTASATTTAIIAQSTILTATPATTVLMFAPAPVAATPTASQTMAASFTVTGYTGTFLPTAVLHYGRSYNLGAVSCTGSGTEICTVPVTFKPLYPGGRRDAIFLMNGTTRLATMLLSGIGQGPLSLLEPGVLTTPHADGNLYFYNSVVDENGTDYVVSGAQSTVTSVTAAGIATQLPIPVYEPQSIAIDGAGVLYVSDLSSKPSVGAPSISVKTYDTVTGVQGSMQNPNGTSYITALALDDNGKLYETDQTNIYELSEYGGPFTTTAINPDPIQTTGFIVDSNGNLFLSGDYGENELTASGVQTQINQRRNDKYGYVVDAADSLYVGRFSNTENVGMLPAANGWSAGIGPDLAPYSAPYLSPLGLGIGGDGTLWVGNYNYLDKVDRSQGAFTFDAASPGQAADPQTAYLYNGGNQPLMLTSLALSGDPNYTLSPPASGLACTAGVSIPAGSLCAVVVKFTAPGSGGIFNGTLTFTTNSLNTVTNQAVTLTDTVSGPVVTLAPGSLTFGTQLAGTTSTAQTVTLSNTGTAALAITSMGVTGANASSFTVGTNTCGPSLAPAATCTVSVAFSPMAAGTFTASFAVVDNVGTQSTSLTGTGSAPTATLTPAAYDFSKVAVGLPSTNVFTFTNTSTTSIAISAIVLAAESTNSYSYTKTCGTTLAAGATCSFTVTFKPTAAGATATTFNVTDDAGTQKAAITGMGIAPTATLTPTTYDFGSVAVGLSQTTVFTLTNTSTTSIAVGTIVLAPEATNSYSYTKTCGTTLAAGAACAFTLTFKPTAGGSSATTLNVTDDAGRQIANITGTGIAPTATLTPATYDFGSVAVGASQTSVFTLTNTSTTSIAVGTVVLAPESTNSYSYTKTCGTSLAAGASCTFTVTFKPTTGGSSATTLNISDDAGVQKATINGSAPQITFSPLDFGTVNIGSDSVQYLRVTNHTNAAVSFMTADRSNPAFDIYLGFACFTIPANATCDFPIVFTPQVAGAQSGTIILTNAAGSFAATVTGTGGTAPQITFSSLDFGTVAIGSSASAYLAFTNHGNLDATFAHPVTQSPFSIALIGTDCSTILANSTCTLAMVFTPTVAGVQSGTVTLSNASRSYTATISGTGSPSATDFTLVSDRNQSVMTSSQPAVFHLALTSATPNLVFGYPITLTYSGTLPAGYKATFSPATVAPGITASVLTIAYSSSAQLARPPAPRSRLPLPLACSLFGIAFLARKRLRRGAFGLLLCLGMMAGAAAMSGCGSSTTFQGTITAKGNGMTHTVAVTLYQNP